MHRSLSLAAHQVQIRAVGPDLCTRAGSCCWRACLKGPSESFLGCGMVGAVVRVVSPQEKEQEISLCKNLIGGGGGLCVDAGLCRQTVSPWVKFHSTKGLGCGEPQLLACWLILSSQFCRQALRRVATSMIRRAMPVRALSAAATRIATPATMRCVVVCSSLERAMRPRLCSLARFLWLLRLLS